MDAMLKTLLAIVAGIAVFMLFNAYTTHLHNVKICGVLTHKVIDNVLYCEYHGAYHKPESLAKIGRK